MSENTEVVKSTASPNPFVKAITGFLSHPSMVWFYLLHITTLLSMIVFNIVRVGFTLDGIFGGPEYYGNLFWYYGLNADPAYVTPYGQGFLAWITSPLLVIFLGVPLYFLMEAGWSPVVDSQIKDLGTKNYAFFPENPYGYDVSFGSKKFNAFFIGVVWLPIIVSSVMLVIYMHKTKKTVHPVLQFIVAFIISMLLGAEFARIQSPNYYFDLQKGFESMFQFRNRSILVQNKVGFYHPTGLGFLMALFHIVAMITGVLVVAIIEIPKKVQDFNHLREMRRAKRIATSTTGVVETPQWIIEREERKEAYLKKQEKLKKDKGKKKLMEEKVE